MDWFALAQVMDRWWVLVHGVSERLGCIKCSGGSLDWLRTSKLLRKEHVVLLVSQKSCSFMLVAMYYA